MTHFTQHARPILIILLAAAFLTPQTPFFVPEDANRDSRVDLRDAVAMVRALALTADAKGDFRGEVGRVISVLQTASGLKTVVKPDSDEQAGITKYGHEFPIAPACCGVNVFISDFLLLTVDGNNFKSCLVEPEVPPPRGGRGRRVV